MIKHNFDPAQPYTYVRYANMSSDSQNPRTSDQQFQVIEDTVARCRHRWVQLRDYRDDEVSGKLIRRRRGFFCLLTDIRNRVIEPDLILLDTSQRLGRREEFVEIRRVLRDRHGVLVLTAESRFSDPTTAAEHVMETFERFRAMEENRLKERQVRRGKLDAIRQNHWPGGSPPFGYKLHSVFVERNGCQEIDYYVLVRDPETSWIIQKLFRRAMETGHGPTKLAAFLNADPDIPATRRVFPGTVGWWLGNPIYRGIFVRDERMTEIVEDVRILEPAAEDDVFIKPDFCEALIDERTWDAVQKRRAIRNEERRLAKEKAQNQAWQPYDELPAMALESPLSDLVTCSHCGRAMTFSAGSKYTTKSGEVKRYSAFYCPGSFAGVCTNKRRIPEPWLLAEILQRIHARLFSCDPNRENDVNDLETRPWFQQLLGLIQDELDRRKSIELCERPDLEQDLDQVRDRMAGLRESLANRTLATNVRQRLEADLAELLNRETELGQKVAAEQQRPQSARELVEPEPVLQRLARLDQVLRADNPKQVNVALSHIVDRIDCSDDGTVTLRMCPVGIFLGAVAAGSDTSSKDESLLAATREILQRVEDREATHFTAAPDRFRRVPEAWFWSETFRQPPKQSWTEQHAEEVYAARFQADGRVQATYEELEKQFRRSRPTLRKAIDIAEERRRRRGDSADDDAT
jgi:DNA invertase Pin-like site-specific DNA recombinase